MQAPLARNRVLGQSDQRKSSAVPDGQPVDQEGSDTLGVNFGVGIGLVDTPLIDSLLERLLRRKQLLMAAAASYAPGWGAVGSAGYYPNPASIYPYAGAGVLGGSGGGGVPWNRPTAYPYPSYGPPSINPFVGFGGGGIGWGFGGIGGGFNPLYDYDDFGFRGNKNGYNNGYNNGNFNNNGNNSGN